MNNLPSASIPSSRYNAFLFAPICEDADGMRLSVLSALARMGVDPWEEATKLAAMPRAIAQSTLISTLELLSGRSWKRPEAEVVAARLIRLLPEGAEAPKAAAGEIAESRRNGQIIGWCGWSSQWRYHFFRRTIRPRRMRISRNPYPARSLPPRAIAPTARSLPRTFNLVSLSVGSPTTSNAAITRIVVRRRLGIVKRRRPLFGMTRRRPP